VEQRFNPVALFVANLLMRIQSISFMGVNAGYAPEKTIRFAAMLKQVYEISIDESKNQEGIIDYKSVLDNVHQEFQSWFEYHKKLKQLFFKEVWSAFRDVYEENEKPSPSWFKLFTSEHRALHKANDPRQYWLHQAPFFDDNKFTENSRLEQVLKEILEYYKIGTDFIEFLLDESSSIHLLKDSTMRSKLHKFAQLDHYEDEPNSRSEKTNKVIIDVLEKQELISILTETAKCSFRLFAILQIIGVEVAEDLAAIELIKQSDQKLEIKFSDNQSKLRAKEVLARLKRLRWGPDDYRRNPKVIDQAHKLLKSEGILSLTGWGGVGKTALAHKLIYDCASAGDFEYFVTLSSKVGSTQKETNVHDGTSDLVDTSIQNSIFYSLLDQDSKTLEGSFRLMCYEIIRTVNPNPNELSNVDDEGIIEKAIETLKENSILITIDNFEDIEEPSKDLSEMERSKITRQYNSFAKFFDAFRHVKAEGSASRILITTRGKGAKLAPYHVTELDSDETFQLFRRKIEVRIKNVGLDARVFEEITKLEDKIKRSFGLWSLKDVDPKNGEIVIKKGVAHPMLVIGAAASVTSSNDIESSINDWKTNGESAKNILSYCTKKTLGGYKKDEVEMISKLARQPFGVSFPYDHPILAIWEYTRRRDFCNQLHERGWLIAEEDGMSWRWRLEIQRQIMYVLGLQIERQPIDTIEQSDVIVVEIELQHEAITEPKLEVREEICSWLQEPAITSNPQKTLLIETTALAPKEIGATTTKLDNWVRELDSEKVSRISDEDLVTLYKIVVGTNGEKLSLVEYIIAKDYSSEIKLELDKVNSTIFSLLGKIQATLFQRLNKIDLDLTLRSCYIMLGKIVKLSDYLTDEQKNEFCFQLFDSLRGIDQNYGMGWMDESSKQFHISELLLISSSFLPTRPSNKSDKLELNSKQKKYCKGWYEFYMEWLSGRTTLDESYHKKVLFWISIRLALHMGPDVRDTYIDTAVEYTIYGYRSVEDISWSPLIVRKYIARIRDQQDTIVWELDELVKQTRFPTMNKVVRLRFERDSYSKQITKGDIRVKLIQKEMDKSGEELRTLFSREMLFVVVNKIDNYYYVEPVLDIDGYPVTELKNSKDYGRLVDNISKAIKEIGSTDLGIIFRFSDLMNKLSELCDFNIENYLTSGIKDRMYTELSQILISMDNSNLLNEYDPERKLVSIGKPAVGEIERVNKWNYEKEYPGDSEKIYSIYRTGMKLPKDPPDMALLFDKFYNFCNAWSDKNIQMTYQEVEDILRTNLSRHVSVYLPSRRRAISAIFRNFIVKISAPKFSLLHKRKPDERLLAEVNYSRYTTYSPKIICERFEELVIYSADKQNIHNSAGINLDLIKSYFEEVRTFL
jgi:hypothetical protein